MDAKLTDMAAFLEPVLGARPGALALNAYRLRGGLEANGVWHLRARYQDAAQRWCSAGCVVKHLPASRMREAYVYSQLLPRTVPELSPGLLGVQEFEGACHIYMEMVRPASRWPWSEIAASRKVLKALARLHGSGAADVSDTQLFSSWDYERELRERAEQVRQLIDENAGEPFLRPFRRSLPAARRIVAALPRIRSQLFALDGFSPTFIHGDVHSGNVVLTRPSAGHGPVFLDWGRSRIGSPLEDVSSWIESVAFWEPDLVRQRDSLLTGYLRACGEPPRVRSEFRDAYWFAAASNVLAGSMLYHWTIAADPNSGGPKRREMSLRALGQSFKVLRRADRCWTEPVGTGCANQRWSQTGL